MKPKTKALAAGIAIPLLTGGLAALVSRSRLALFDTVSKPPDFRSNDMEVTPSLACSAGLKLRMAVPRGMDDSVCTDGDRQLPHIYSEGAAGAKKPRASVLCSAAGVQLFLDDHLFQSRGVHCRFCMAVDPAGAGRRDDRVIFPDRQTRRVSDAPLSAMDDICRVPQPRRRADELKAHRNGSRGTGVFSFSLLRFPDIEI